ncbi:MAG: methionine--tRNA ligase [Micavibrio sp.]|nr:methionine--tRNA ligase [Micavibrio sp.]|tara:strand:+ start:1421 stop:3124 length:1704 start_codon:yes stop_codon:yes gene_type:complete
MARTLITSALPYINGIKHLGNLVGSMLPADVHARFKRLRGDEVLFICATDEHGTPAELAAQKEGKSVADYCREMYEVQKDIYTRFDLSFDWFGRSSSQQNHDLTQHFYHQLDQNVLLEEVTTRQVYAIDDARFLPDRYVEGECPHCHYENARGDQCENCTRVLDPTDLINPRSAVSGSTNVEVRESKHLFLRQSQMVDKLRSWIESNDNWSHLVRSIAFKWLDEGLKDRAITRDLSWGIPVAYQGTPRPGFENKVFYVWFDAPIEYIAATAEWAEHNDEDWERWWRTNSGAGDVEYVQFMGKDNVPFHTVGFPVTQFGANEDWKVVDMIKGLNWMNYYGGKFSTSQKRGIFMDQALDILPSDYWRWYLMSNAPEGSDASFTWETLQSAINKDLADVLGNLVNRVVKFCGSRFDGKIPTGGTYGDTENETTRALQEKFESYTANMEAMEYRKATSDLRAMWVIGNEYLQRAEPWKIFKEDAEAAGASIRYALNLIAFFSNVSAPFIPRSAQAIADLFTEQTLTTQWPDTVESMTDALIPDGIVATPDVLFTKIEDEQVEEWKTQFGGA